MHQTITAMVETHPTEIRYDRQLLEECIAACAECAQACTSCAEACLSETHVDPLRRCIRANLDCADLCATTARVLTRHASYGEDALLGLVLAACAEACRACGDECASHAEMHRHCEVCAGACRRCAEACERLLATL
ncbi:MAG TPA: four-helix bundle copper-binding protein [Nocardioides sp.]|nr:four-helix bundle copper-binding protein [Nocardioides sp.]